MATATLRTAAPARNGRPLRSALRFLAALWVAEWPVAAALTAAVCLQGVLPAARLWVLGRLVNGIAAAVRGAGPAPVGALALLVALMAASHALGQAVAALGEHLTDRTTQSFQRRILEKAAALDLAFFEAEEAHDRLQRAARATDMELATFYTAALEPVQGLVTAVALAATLATAAWWLGPLLLLAALPVLTLKLVRTAHQFGWKLDETPVERRRSYFQRLLHNREAAKEVRLFGLGEHLLRRWDEQQQALHHGRLRQAAAEARVSLTSEGVLIAALAAATLLLAYHVAGGTLSLGAYVMLAQAATELQGAVDGLLVGLRGAYLRALSADDVFAFLDRPDPASGPGGEMAANGETGGRAPGGDERAARRKPGGTMGRARFPSPLRDGIRGEDVWFRYRPDGDWTLRELSFSVRAGETISLVGENGAGKTTLVKLLLGLYRPERGRILFDGLPLEHMDAADVRRHCSAIFQDFAHFRLTLRESIGIGDVGPLAGEPGAGADAKGKATRSALAQPSPAGPTDPRDAWERRIERAATRAGVEAIAAGLERGYDTVLSPAFGGVDLSGGQWQKVALARSLMRDAQVLILDEPTASLDPRAELAVFEQFRALAVGRTTFLISHRIGTARLADRILVLRQGRLVESGSHAELVAAAGDYAELFTTQRQWYEPQPGGEPAEGA